MRLGKAEPKGSPEGDLQGPGSLKRGMETLLSLGPWGQSTLTKEPLLGDNTSSSWLLSGGGGWGWGWAHRGEGRAAWTEAPEGTPAPATRGSEDAPGALGLEGSMGSWGVGHLALLSPPQGAGGGSVTGPSWAPLVWGGHRPLLAPPRPDKDGFSSRTGWGRGWATNRRNMLIPRRRLQMLLVLSGQRGRPAPHPLAAQGWGRQPRPPSRKARP